MFVGAKLRLHLPYPWLLGSILCAACSVKGGLDAIPGGSSTADLGITSGGASSRPTSASSTGVTSAAASSSSNAGASTGPSTAGDNASSSSGSGTASSSGSSKTSTSSSGSSSSKTSTSSSGSGTASSSGSSGSSGSSKSSTGSSGSGTGSDKKTPPDNLLICDPGRTDECGEGMKCSAHLTDLSKTQTDATHCVEVTGQAQLGQACTRNRDTGMDDCAPMLFCDAGCSACDGPGRCVAFCNTQKDPTQDCLDRGVEGGYCFAFNLGALPICKKVCDPLAQDCAKDSEACYPALDNYLCAEFRPEKGSSGLYGQPCDRVQSCAEGLACVDAAQVAACAGQDGHCCAQLCDLTVKDPQCSEAGESCRRATQAPVAGADRVGVCSLPPSDDERRAFHSVQSTLETGY